MWRVQLEREGRERWRRCLCVAPIRNTSLERYYLEMSLEGCSGTEGKEENGGGESNVLQCMLKVERGNSCSNFLV